MWYDSNILELGVIVMDLEPLVNASDISAAAQWLNNFFGSFDQAILTFYHNVHEALGTPMDVVVQLFTKLGDDGIFLIILSLILMLFKKSRKVGFGMLFGIAIGAVFTNLAIKNVVARPRPYMYAQNYRDWFLSIWHCSLESEYSFPSGHTTAAMASMTPVFLSFNKKKSWTAFLFVIALGATRNYIMVHFPSDIIGGIIIGGIAGILSYLLVNLAYQKIIAKGGKPANALQNADITNLIRKKTVNVEPLETDE